MNKNQNADYEYIIVGSGAGGGTLAARLAEAGRKVLVLEAGGDPKQLQGGNAIDPKGDRMPQDYDVPVFHALSTENEAIRWDYFVRHYADDPLQKKDTKYVEEYPPGSGKKVDGILYPRAGCLGGCTAHNAMITVYPHNQDWDDLAYLTGDASWSSSNMRKYFEKIENCQHRLSPYRWLAKHGFNPTRHGWSGWLQTEKEIPKAALGDNTLVKTLTENIKDAFKAIGDPLSQLDWLVHGQADPNDWRLVKKNAFGIRYAPLLTRNHARLGTRERLLEVQSANPGTLTIELDALATRVLLDKDNRAIGVEYLKGGRLYQAHDKSSQEPGEKHEVYASREVILAGGAFNTPQLLMLSGIGPGKELKKHGIKVRVDLPGVGKNLQDRYEVGVEHRMSAEWEILKGATYSKGDPQYQQWENNREGAFAGKDAGLYASNGAALAVIKRSVPERFLPDLFIFALLAKFGGYVPGYSKDVIKHNYLTWAVLKAHTNNTAGEVCLKSSDPRERPYINFKYFDEGNDYQQEDLKSVVEGVKFVRQLTAPLKAQGLIAEEVSPGENVQTDEQIADFVKYQSWGHHASCTCPIGKDGDPMAVLDGNFKVRGVQNLRVVDASVFPRIPGFFIVSSIYMIAEKAADVILSDAHDIELYKNERYKNGSKANEIKEFQDHVKRVLAAQKQLAEKHASQQLRRVFHAKTHACLTGKLNLLEDRPKETQNGIFGAGGKTSYNVLARFSNGVGYGQHDLKPDVRGLALKIFGVDAHLAKDGNPLPRTIDFLMTNSTNPFGKDQEEFIEFMEANVAPGFLNENLVKFLITHPEVRHLLLHATLRIVPSLVTETYWSGHPYLLGPNQAMKFNVRPSPDSKFAIDDEDLKEILAAHRKFESGSLGDNFENQIRQWLEPLEDISSKINANYLGIDLLNRVKRGPVKFIFSVQLEKDKKSTPIENTLIEWKENDSPSIPVAELILDQQHKSLDCSNLRFTPGHFIPDHRPLGNLGRGRICTYEASQKGRNADANEPEENVFFGN